MRKLVGILFAFWLCGLLAAMGAGYSLVDGSTVSGEPVSFNDNGIIFKTGQDTYSDRLPWLKFSQAGLKQLAQNPKIAPFVEPFIEPAASEHAKPEVKLNDVPRLEHPAGGSLFGALFTSSVGLVVMLLVYAANIFAGYEAAVFRARPIGLGLGLAAALPVLGPIILLSMPPPQAAPVEEILETAPLEAEPHRFTVPGLPTPTPVPQEEIHIVASGFTGASPPPDSSPTEIFQRGQFMFNRRFFETKFAGFFGIARPEADRNKILTVKIPAALLTVERISRISANEIHFEVVQGGERQEIMVPFAEIQQIQLKFKS
ncbi:MAG TPA: hypothetical protein VE344_12275 [Methylomirabilota bacterium]|nr:hypothetical protein [Methylomirabilota bacterium]